MSQSFVRYDKPFEGVASITLQRPEALNAINMTMRDDLWTYIQAALIDPVAPHQVQNHLEVGIRIAQAVNRRYGGHHDSVLALHQRLGSRQAHLLDMAVDGGVLLNVGVGGRHIGLGLVVVVVRHEILHPVARKEIPKFPVELRRQRLVGRQHQRRPLLAGHHAGQGIGLARAGHSKKSLPGKSKVQPFAKRLHGPGLIAGQLKIRLQLKPVRRHGRTLASASRRWPPCR